ncbi:hypothetical protein KKF91_08520 [Myxococcota bacterium]|nr:hypothetical protein [Myxococcota bacterium]MBU1430583.1 hypothetical protein [Myxococcota bacterium]MBU1896611.1 hypothetical protein [Myxococcota bacterium]
MSEGIAPRGWVAGLLGLCLALSAADAAPLPNRFVLARARARLAQPWPVEARLSGEDHEAKAPLDLALSVRPAARHFEARFSDGREIDATLLLIWSRLFFEGDPSLLARDLGVDLRASHLALLGDHVCHVIGAPRGPQIYFDQDSFTPLRVWVPARGEAEGLEVEMTRWAGPPSAGRFPRRMRVRVGRRWVMTLGLDAYQAEASTSAPLTSRP